MSLTESLSHSLRTFTFDIQRATLETLVTLRHLIRVIRRHDLTEKNDKDKYKDKDKDTDKDMLRTPPKRHPRDL